MPNHRAAALALLGLLGCHVGTRVERFPVATGPAGVAIFLSFFGAAREGASLLKNSGLVYLGNIAYGLYAYHYVGREISARVFAPYHTHAHNYSYTLSLPLGLAITFLLAAASFKWLETPFLRLKQRFTHIPSGLSKLEPKDTSEFVPSRLLPAG